jgi:glycosyltransferase involved in cell wall biosynthesis
MTRILEAILITLGDPNRLTGGYLYHRRMAELAPHNGARLRFVSLPARPFPAPILSAPAVLRRTRRAGPRVVVLDSIAAPFLGPWLVMRRFEIPMVPMLHQPPGGIDHGPARTIVQAWLDHLAYRGDGPIMVASDALADDLAREGLRRERLIVIPPGRDVAVATGPDPGDLRRGRRVAVLCAGNWVERKGIHDLLEAVAALPEDAVTLHLAGDDRAEPAYATRLQARISRPDLAGRVVTHGAVSREDIAALYNASDIFALPSRREPYGTVYGEAMAFGLPVVGWNAGNLPHLAANGREGLLVERGDVPALTDALRRLAEDEPLRARLGAAARERAQQRLTWEESASLFFATLGEAAN